MPCNDVTESYRMSSHIIVVSRTGIAATTQLKSELSSYEFSHSVLILKCREKKRPPLLLRPDKLAGDLGSPGQVVRLQPPGERERLSSDQFRGISHQSTTLLSLINRLIN